MKYNNTKTFTDLFHMKKSFTVYSALNNSFTNNKCKIHPKVLYSVFILQTSVTSDIFSKLPLFCTIFPLTYCKS